LAEADHEEHDAGVLDRFCLGTGRIGAGAGLDSVCKEDHCLDARRFLRGLQFPIGELQPQIDPRPGAKDNPLDGRQKAGLVARERLAHACGVREGH
jgi:hypothetical protein